MSGPALSVALAVVMVGTAACSESTGRDGGGGVDGRDVVDEPGRGGDAEAGGDGGGDEADVEAGGPLGPGPITLVAEIVELSDERICDLDGDGSEDNALADLGPTDGQMLALAVNSFVATAYGENYPIIFHVPWVDELGGPDDGDATLTVFLGLDDEHVGGGVRDRSDDYSGDEPFVVDPTHLDACGEPRFAFEHVAFAGGDFETEGAGTLFAPLTTHEVLLLQGGRLSGTIERGGAAGAWKACGYAPIHDLGGLPSDILPDSTLLEVLLAGGVGVGFPSLPGIAPNVDVDGDGLERILLDDLGHIERCVDGDDTPIPGRDCWTDTRMADAFALTVAMEGPSARFEGRPEYWEQLVRGECVDPPQTSLWEPR